MFLGLVLMLSGGVWRYAFLQGLNQLAEQRLHDEDRAQELAQMLILSEPELEQAQEQAHYCEEQLGLAEATLDNWRSEWQAYQEQAGAAQRLADVVARALTRPESCQPVRKRQ